MKFILSWQPYSNVKEELIERFRTIGKEPPEGIQLLGRWTKADLGGGYALVETSDPKRLAAFAYQWIDLMQLNIVPVVEDPDLNQVFTEFDELMGM